MTLNEMISRLTQVAAEYPEAADQEVTMFDPESGGEYNTSTAYFDMETQTTVIS
jgi:hypothetical protein